MPSLTTFVQRRPVLLVAIVVVCSQLGSTSIGGSAQSAYQEHMFRPLQVGELPLKIRGSVPLPSAQRNKSTPRPQIRHFSCGTPGARAVTAAAGAVALNRSAAKTLCSLVRVRDGRVLARSYNRFGWEVFSSLGNNAYLKFEQCSDTACGVFLPNDGNAYRLVASTYSLSAKAKIAGFLNQATFGARSADLTSWSGDFTQWIVNQMSLPLTSHRAFYRARANATFIKNTIEKPAAGKVWKSKLSSCLTARPSFLNRHTCTVAPKGVCGNTSAILCGSPEEGARFLNLGTYFVGTFDDEENASIPCAVTHHATWLTVSLNSKDQLRQRMAFALSQIVVLGNLHISNEGRMAFYDIFVRHAFGNYRDVLKEITYSPLMGSYLTFLGSRSFAAAKQEYYPDENFARELLQLFSIGAAHLNNDGTPRVDKFGNSLPTYDNDDIMSAARIWTGFTRDKRRLNVQEDGRNTIDPMIVNPWLHDMFPKMNLQGGYVGDGYPLCQDSPKKNFLRKGAEFHIVSKKPSRVDLELKRTSNLYASLCGGNIVQCTYRGKVVLDRNIACSGDECKVDYLKYVSVNGEYYQYVEPACVTFPFFTGGETGPLPNFPNYCSNPRVAAATRSKKLCSIQAKIDRRGFVAIVHNIPGVPLPLAISNQTGNYFRVNWKVDAGAHVPNADTNKCGACKPVSGACICDIDVKETRVFSSMPSRNGALSQLYIGSYSHELLDGNLFVKTPAVDGVEAFHKKGSSPFSIDTHFSVNNSVGEKVYYRNMRSIVQLVNASVQFRNPPMFNPLYPVEETRMIDAEVDAYLDGLMHHPNTAPFIARRLIQRFGTSNPSPRYVTVVARAFRQGIYRGIGSGTNGDLAATIAAILLDREARSVVLLSSPTHGQIREPLLKALHVMRSLEFKSTKGDRPLVLNRFTMDFIEQMPYASRTVFSFFDPFYVPDYTRAENSGIVIPEASALTSSAQLVLVSRLLSLVKNNFSRQSFAADNFVSAVQTFKAASVIDDMNVLLTNGRLSAASRKIISNEYQRVRSSKGDSAAAQYASQLFLLTPEFHTTGAGLPADARFADRTVSANAKAPQVAKKKQWEVAKGKAIIYIQLQGGSDSFNMLVPHSQCDATNLRGQYESIRGRLALSLDKLLPIDVPKGQQRCSKFGLHYNMGDIQKMYREGDALLLANTGHLVEPLDANNIYSKKTPRGNYGHDTMTVNTESVNGQSDVNGVLGRMIDSIAASGKQAASFTLRRSSQIQRGDTQVSADLYSVSSTTLSVRHAVDGAKLIEVTEKLSTSGTNVFADYWGATMLRSLNRSAFLKNSFDSTQLDTAWPSNSSLSRQLQQVSKLIKLSNSMGTEFSTYSVGLGGFDTHHGLGPFDSGMKMLNDALAGFAAEMKAQGMWDDVVVVTGSEFGRTLKPNANGGTDHAWGGNYMMVGGSVKGGQILGEYPDISEKGPQILGGNRIIPTTPWDSVWNCVAQWAGASQQLDSILPNRRSFSNLFKRDQCFAMS